MKITRQKITPFLWFNTQAEEAAQFYTSVFEDSKIGRVTRYNQESAEVSGRPANSVMTVEFELAGQDFIALNGGPEFKFTEAISFMVHCENQAELDRYWNGLAAGGKEIQCGWLKDKFGLAWQIVPAELNKLLAQDDPAKAGRVMRALLSMVKLDIQQLKDAAAGP